MNFHCHNRTLEFEYLKASSTRKDMPKRTKFIINLVVLGRHKVNFLCKARSYHRLLPCI